MLTLTIRETCPYFTAEQWAQPEPAGEEHQTLPTGTVVEYRGHVPGGMVAARHGEQNIVIHPLATEELK